MSINKHALIRYQTLDKCFRNTGRMYFIDDLLEACNHALLEVDINSNGIQKRQLYDDINFMESPQGWSVPLKKEQSGKKKYYYYQDASFSINNQPLNDSEVEQIKSALQVFSRFSGTPQFEWVNEMIPMLESKFGLIERKHEVISFEENVDLKGVDLIQPIFNAIVNTRVLKVTYKDFKSKESYQLTFHPYYLKQYNGRWFVFGLNPEVPEVAWNLALDRIISLKEKETKYILTTTDWEDYFSDLIGVTKPVNAEVEEIKLRFSASLSPYIVTKPLHQTQQTTYSADELEVRIKVIPNYELERLILSFADQVQVISPLHLKKKIVNRLSLASGQYSSN